MEKKNGYDAVVFDMDGTLVNSYPGIFDSYAWTFQHLGP